ncbi:YhbY family RNA-binding protein [Marinomonas hwangdonensis]|uniref:YhbY family RNA-binding protein n=1 Tax=Marinomonas hwangdonensis TaxID=1053647 RepID=A0A3M8Q9I8_9GAMM|nr:YhbY family RNA-binding protein [Marinomonas hwangdonensis]MDP5055652.1 YhbY family RNA-binding protein [Marinomonas hwangdonensis]RNF52733.1 YhbY family RNA-binding protein [Marinomonas hwangdonensis]
MSLTNAQKKQYRLIGHSLNPVVMIAGNGLTETVLTEVDRALEDHELIKVRISIADRETRNALIAEISKIMKCETVQTIGKVALFYRAALKPNPKLSNLLR